MPDPENLLLIPQSSQTVPWGYVIVALATAAATLAGIFLDWYLRRSSRNDPLRSTVYEKKLDLILRMDAEVRDLEDLLRRFCFVDARRKRIYQALERELDGEKEVTRRMKEKAEEDLITEFDSLQSLRGQISTTSLQINDLATTCRILLDADTSKEAAQLTATIREVILSVEAESTPGDISDDATAGHQLVQVDEILEARNNFVDACRKELGIEELDSETKQILETSRNSSMSMPQIPDVYFEAGLKGGIPEAGFKFDYPED